MCLAIPMRIIELREMTGVVELEGVQHEVNLSLVDEPRVGEYVIVHAGFAIETLDEQEAEARLELFRELAAAEDPPPPPGESR
jgi:hydrogenase expression/formation protein HypC